MHPGEKFNTISHLIAAIIAVPGLIYLVILAAETSDPWKITSVSIYGVSLVLLYISSTLCHGHSGRYEKFFEKMDHLSIYLLIAGTYTPYMLVTLRGIWGWSIFAIVWSLALIGILIDIWPSNKAKNDNGNEKEPTRFVQLVIYLVMGWLIVVAMRPLADKLDGNGIALLALGGILYSVGVIFFVLSDRFKHAHGIWHLFVIGGSVSHYLSISNYVI
ncbi:MAG: hemolysin III [Cocleimonas sp.]|jgi:hemolysin III